MSTTTTTEAPDLYHVHTADYTAHVEPQLVRIEPAAYLAIEGMGEPGGEVFTHKLATLYSVAYTIKLASKRRGHDFPVTRLGALWWEPGKTELSPKTRRDRWCWKLLRSEEHTSELQSRPHL